MSKSVTFTREHLYELVWSEPISKIGPKFGVSDVAIAKICKKLNVPRPLRGYWVKIKYGHRVHKPRLPKLKKGAANTYELSPPSRPIRIPPKLKKATPTVMVKSKVRRYHPVVAELRSRLAEGQKDKYHRISTHPRTGISVSKQILPRACRILDALLRELQRRDFEASIEEHDLTIQVEQSNIRIELLEPAKRLPQKKDSKWGYQYWDYKPTGRLTLTLWSYHLYGLQTSWSDTNSKCLEDRLGSVVRLFEAMPEMIRTEREEQQQRELKRQRRLLCQRRQSDVVNLTKARADQVDQLIGNLEKARSIRAWINDVGGSHNPPASTKRLAKWASQYANHLDPLVDFTLNTLERSGAVEETV